MRIFLNHKTTQNTKKKRNVWKWTWNHRSSSSCLFLLLQNYSWTRRVYLDIVCKTVNILYTHFAREYQPTNNTHPNTIFSIIIFFFSRTSLVPSVDRWENIKVWTLLLNENKIFEYWERDTIIHKNLKKKVISFNHRCCWLKLSSSFGQW